MKKFLTLIIAIAAVGIGYWLISPLFITRRVDEKLEDIMATVPPPAPAPSPAQLSNGKLGGQAPLPPAGGETTTPALMFQTVSEGTFVGLGSHSGRGTAKLLRIGGKYYVRFEDDFRVTNGPNLFVYLGKDGAYAAEARLAALKGNEGGQNYEVPGGINPLDYTAVWVWCRAFSVPFAKAELR